MGLSDHDALHGASLVCGDDLKALEKFLVEAAVKLGEVLFAYRFEGLPWAHPATLEVEWISGNIPRRPCPAGVVTHYRGKDYKLDELPHFVPSCAPLPPASPQMATFRPPVGANLI